MLPSLKFYWWPNRHKVTLGFLWRPHNECIPSFFLRKPFGKYLVQCRNPNEISRQPCPIQWRLTLKCKFLPIHSTSSPVICIRCTDIRISAGFKATGFFSLNALATRFTLCNVPSESKVHSLICDEWQHIYIQNILGAHNVNKMMGVEFRSPAWVCTWMVVSLLFWNAQHSNIRRLAMRVRMLQM